MSKTYTSKSNANRAARKAGLPETAVSCDAAGLYSVNFPVVAEGVDGPGQDDVPTRQIEATAAPLVMLASSDDDYGLCLASSAARSAQDLANSVKVEITARDPITDEVVATYQPASFDQLSERSAGQQEDLAAEEPEVGAANPERAQLPVNPELVAEAGDALSELSKTCVISFSVANVNAVAIGQLLANKYGVPVSLNDTATGAALTEMRPLVKGAKAAKAVKAEKAPKAAKAAGTKVREPRAAKAAPSGMRLQIIEACCRKGGATPAYLNDMTKWKKAPWKWLMSNPKGTGLCDRYGYTLTVGRNIDDKGAVYKMTKNAA